MLRYIAAMQFLTLRYVAATYIVMLRYVAATYIVTLRYVTGMARVMISVADTISHAYRIG